MKALIDGQEVNVNRIDRDGYLTKIETDRGIYLLSVEVEAEEAISEFWNSQSVDELMELITHEEFAEMFLDGFTLSDKIQDSIEGGVAAFWAFDGIEKTFKCADYELEEYTEAYKETQ